MKTYKNESPQRLTSFDEIWRAALELPPNARAMLAGHLLESLDHPEQTEIDAAWSEEIERRIRDVDEGRVRLIPGEEVLAELRSRFK
ncbi:MAG TPA: addiction module protein [Pyrinomonadaceae bacterium]|nr:addiction module protein [Pyrinomonadaceae bacterium]